MSSKVLLLALIVTVLIVACTCFPAGIPDEIQTRTQAEPNHNIQPNLGMGARVARQFFGYPYYPGGFYGGGGSASQAQAQAQASSGSGGTYFG